MPLYTFPPDSLEDKRTALPDPPEFDFDGGPIPSELKWTERRGFPELDPEIVLSKKLEVKFAAPWKYHEHITLLEARTIVRSFSRSLRDHKSFNRHHLVLSDSFACCLAFSEGRSPHFGMLT